MAQNHDMNNYAHELFFGERHAMKEFKGYSCKCSFVELAHTHNGTCCKYKMELGHCLFLQKKKCGENVFKSCVNFI